MKGLHDRLPGQQHSRLHVEHDVVCIQLNSIKFNFKVCLWDLCTEPSDHLHAFSCVQIVPLLALWQKMRDPHRGIAGDQIRHGISFPR